MTKGWSVITDLPRLCPVLEITHCSGKVNGFCLYVTKDHKSFKISACLEYNAGLTDGNQPCIGFLPHDSTSKEDRPKQGSDKYWRVKGRRVKPLFP